MYLLGYDIGSSSVKAALVDVDANKTVGVTQSPQTEMEISAPQPDWAEQHPDDWWINVQKATKELLRETGIEPNLIKGIGISYQMHGLVIVDSDQNVIRPSIIWCDSRAVEIGDQAFKELGEDYCFNHLLNGPGNFTASKLKWVKENEPQLFEKIHKCMLPGDFIAMKMTGEIRTTAAGLSEGMMWDFASNKVASGILDHFGIDHQLVPELVPMIGDQGSLTDEAASVLGLFPGIPVGYRSGDQPNNAMSLNVLEPGEVAGTGGTSGVVYGVVDQNVCDKQQRVNTFAHVNHSKESPKLGVLLCINGAGIQYGWVKNQLNQSGSYSQMEEAISSIPIGSDGLRIIPFGNGAERIFNNRNLGSHVNNLHFNRHNNSHYFRAALEGIAFSFAYGIDILKELGLEIEVIKVGNDNLFQSPVFSNTVASLANANIEVIETTGAVGAARAAGVAAGVYRNINEATEKINVVKVYESASKNDLYKKSYDLWLEDLEKLLID